MPVEINNTKYICPYCDSKYIVEDDAIECRDDCCVDHADDVEIRGDMLNRCVYCGMEFKKYKDACKCEQKHRKNKDEYYYEYLRKQSFLKLKLAAEHKEQIKLTNSQEVHILKSKI